jgi:hypothetical protein
MASRTPISAGRRTYCPDPRIGLRIGYAQGVANLVSALTARRSAICIPEGSLRQERRHTGHLRTIACQRTRCGCCHFATVGKSIELETIGIKRWQNSGILATCGYLATLWVSDQISCQYRLFAVSDKRPVNDGSNRSMCPNVVNRRNCSLREVRNEALSSRMCAPASSHLQHSPRRDPTISKPERCPDQAE